MVAGTTCGPLTARIAALTAFHLPDGSSVPFSQWFWIEEGKIAKIRVIYDPRPFLELAAEVS